ncbi:MAG: co-chaperone DjlA [Woeseiaceae bacterium]|nr:co-chaperone DjlA [Woeseiaceae bacterium]
MASRAERGAFADCYTPRMFIVFLGALIGLMAGGVPGLFIGAALGYGAGWLLRESVLGGLRVAQDRLLDSTFAIMGALCKADSVVTRDEIRVVERIFSMLRLDESQRSAARDAFRRGKQPDFDLDGAVDRFAALVRGRAPMIQLFLQLQCMAVAADGRIHPAEHEMLVRIAQRLGLHEIDIARLEALLRASSTGTGGQPARSARKRLDDAYAALGVTPDDSPAAIKKAYRRLISENHPDKLAARGLPESMRAVAEERSREINAAYDLIKEARGIV